jgi:hypothetical protein
MARTKGNHGHKRMGMGGANGPSGMSMTGGMPAPPPGAPSSVGSDNLGANEAMSMPAPMPSASSAIPGGAGAGSMTPDAGGFKRGGRVG